MRRTEEGGSARERSGAARTSSRKARPGCDATWAAVYILRSSTTAQPSASHSAGSGGASSATSTKAPTPTPPAPGGGAAGGGAGAPAARGASASRVSSSERPSFLPNSARATLSGAQPAAMVTPSSFSIAASTEPGLTNVSSASPFGRPSASR